jgi:hypothetical protein
MRTVEQRQRRPEQFLIQRVGVFGRERREIGVATGIERATQRADLVCQCLGPNADLVKGDPIAPQYPQPGRVLRGQIHQHRLVGREQGLRRFGRERLRVAQLGIGRKRHRDPSIEVVEAAGYSRKRTAQPRLLNRFAVGRHATHSFHESTIEPLPLLH